MARSDKEALEVQVNRLQHKVKDLGEDFRMRLIKYVEDISVCIAIRSNIYCPLLVHEHTFCFSVVKFYALKFESFLSCHAFRKALASIYMFAPPGLHGQW